MIHFTPRNFGSSAGQKQIMYTTSPPPPPPSISGSTSRETHEPELNQIRKKSKTVSSSPSDVELVRYDPTVAHETSSKSKDVDEKRQRGGCVPVYETYSIEKIEDSEPRACGTFWCPIGTLAPEIV